MSHIAFIMLDIPDLGGGGGAERFFADFFETYNKQKNPEHTLYFICDDITRLQKAGFMLHASDKIIPLKNSRHIRFSRIPFLQRWLAQTIGNRLTANDLKELITRYQIQLLHIPLYEKRDLRIWQAIDRLNKELRPKLVLNIVDCRIPYVYDNNEIPNAGEHWYGPLFRSVRFDGIYSWYEKFLAFARSRQLFPPSTLLQSITSRYAGTETSTTYPEQKSNTVVWASRMDKQKDPLFFVNAIHCLRQKAKPEQIQGWKFLMYGKGPLEKETDTLIEKLNLTSLIERKYSDTMTDIFRSSKGYVSTQEYENFPSLSMAEAMSMGNTVFAKNVGQTSLFVKDKENGYVFDESDPSELGALLLRFITSDDATHKRFGETGMRRMRDVHNRENFIRQTNTFWNLVLSKGS